MRHSHSHQSWPGPDPHFPRGSQVLHPSSQVGVCVCVCICPAQSQNKQLWHLEATCIPDARSGEEVPLRKSQGE